MGELTHFDRQGRACMVDLGSKAPTERRARASVRVLMQVATWECLTQGELPKGDAATVCRIAGIQAAKRTADLIPLCHPLALTCVEVEVLYPEPGVVVIEAETACYGATGVEMEAMTAAAVAGLTLYDMVKGMDRGAEIGPLRLEEKSGGRSGHYRSEVE